LHRRRSRNRRRLLLELLFCLFFGPSFVQHQQQQHQTIQRKFIMNSPHMEPIMSEWQKRGELSGAATERISSPDIRVARHTCMYNVVVHDEPERKHREIKYWHTYSFGTINKQQQQQPAAEATFDGKIFAFCFGLSLFKKRQACLCVC